MLTKEGSIALPMAVHGFINVPQWFPKSQKIRELERGSLDSTVVIFARILLIFRARNEIE